MMGSIFTVDEGIIVGKLFDAEIPALGRFVEGVLDGGILE